ncbi:Secretion system apparatus protein ssaP [Yersinia mollaretii]|uniref:Secretion system apparatus protein ssaP n=1 Tax=Yersinia mollaretii TaxID=33060 RepID=UPI00119DC351|nr:Secretion system apparatus protein ssaP [Yersinia mollaretii]
MNVIRAEGCIWNTVQDNGEEELSRSSYTHKFTRLMGPMVKTPRRSTEQSALLRQQTNRYRLVGGGAAGLVCEINVIEGKTHLKMLVPQYALFTLLTHFSTWLNTGLHAAGHCVTLEVVYAQDIT